MYLVKNQKTGKIKAILKTAPTLAFYTNNKNFLIEEVEDTLPTENIDNVKQHMIKTVNNILKSKINGTQSIIDPTTSEQLMLKYQDKILYIDTSDKGRANLAYTISNLKQDKQVHWKFKDNMTGNIIYETLSKSTLKKINNIIFHYIEELYKCAHDHINRINGAQTIDELRTYDVFAGWPTNYIELE